MPAHDKFWPKRLPRTLTPLATGLAENLRVSARRYPNKVANWFFGRVQTYAEYAWPKGMGSLFERNGTVVSLVIALSITIASSVAGRAALEGVLLLVHGEVTSSDIDLFDREAVFIEQQLAPLRRDFPGLKIVMEHITTKEAAQYVAEADEQLGATITAHHLLYNRNAIFTGGIRPHYYCLPVLKRETHRLALVQAATSGNAKFFLGTDSAPHPAHLKEHATGCAGCYTAHAAIEMYAEAFDAAGALDKLEAFASFNGADFYGLPRNSGTVTLRRESWTPAESFAFGDAELKPLRAGEALPWRLVTA